MGLVVAAQDTCLLITRLEDENAESYTGEALYRLNLEGLFANE